jgi:hypothetical protein
MTFALVRINWPNTAAILALAVMPVVALTMPSANRPQAVETATAAAAANCPLVQPMVAMTPLGGTSLE